MGRFRMPDQSLPIRTRFREDVTQEVRILGVHHPIYVRKLRVDITGLMASDRIKIVRFISSAKLQNTIEINSSLAGAASRKLLLFP